eukprot:5081934-Amphidinium_carterae.2
MPRDTEFLPLSKGGSICGTAAYLSPEANQLVPCRVMTIFPSTRTRASTVAVFLSCLSLRAQGDHRQGGKGC